MIWGGDAANYTIGADYTASGPCFPEAMNSYQVKGKIVLCDAYPQGFFSDGSAILLANGVGTIMTVSDPIYTDFAFNYPLPATLISVDDWAKILDYIRATE